MKKLTKSKKAELVESFTNEIKDSNTNVLVSFSGLSVSDMQKLRKELKKTGCNMQVVKNTLLERIYKNAGKEDIVANLEGPMFVIWTRESKNEVGLVRSVIKFKKASGEIKIRAGSIGDRVFSSDEMEFIGNLPERKQLESNVVWNIKSPFFRIVNALRFPVIRLARDINQISEKKENLKQE